VVGEKWIVNISSEKTLIKNSFLTFPSQFGYTMFSTPAKPLSQWDMLKCGGFFIRVPK